MISISKLSQQKKQVIFLFTSTILGLVIGMFSSIINTRFLDPVSFGDVNYVVNIYTFFAGLFLLGYFTSGSRLLAVAKSRDEVKELKGVLLIILGLTVGLLMIVTLLVGLIHSFVLCKSSSDLFYYAIPICGYPILLNYINTTSQGDNKIGVIASARVLPTLFYILVAVVLYSYIGCSSKIMLTLQYGIGSVVLFVILYYEHPSFKNIKKRFDQLNKENKSYGLHVYLGSIVAVSTQYFAGISLGLFSVDNRYVGFYSLAVTLAAPISMLPQIVATTSFKKFANSNEISPKVLKSTILITVLSFLGFIVLIYPFVSLIYPPEYSMVAFYSSILGIGNCLYGLGDVFNRFLGAHGKGTWIRNGAIVCGIVTLIGYSLGVYFWGIWAAIITKILSSSVYAYLMIHYYKSFTNSH